MKYVGQVENVYNKSELLSYSKYVQYNFLDLRILFYFIQQIFQIKS